MHKLILAFLIAVLMSPSYSTGRVVHWEKLVGWKHNVVTAYVDTSTVEHDDELDFGYGVLLFTRDIAVNMEVGGKDFTVNAVAVHLVIDCKNAKMAPISEFYFNTTVLPSATTVPLTAIDFSDSPPLVSTISKKHTFFRILCPDYI
jgi:hypothetical protein